VIIATNKSNAPHPFSSAAKKRFDQDAWSDERREGLGGHKFDAPAQVVFEEFGEGQRAALATTR